MEIDNYDPMDGSYRRSKGASRSELLIPRIYVSPHIIFGLAVHDRRAWPATKGTFPPQLYIEYNSPFRMMIEGVLDKNMFPLKLPQNETDEGYLIFGGFDKTAFEGDLVSHPIFSPRYSGASKRHPLHDNHRRIWQPHSPY
jgi:hypothetical protein